MYIITQPTLETATHVPFNKIFGLKIFIPSRLSYNKIENKFGFVRAFYIG